MKRLESEHGNPELPTEHTEHTEGVPDFLKTDRTDLGQEFASLRVPSRLKCRVEDLGVPALPGRATTIRPAAHAPGYLGEPKDLARSAAVTGDLAAFATGFLNFEVAIFFFSQPA